MPTRIVGSTCLIDDMFEPMQDDAVGVETSANGGGSDATGEVCNRPDGQRQGDARAVLNRDHDQARLELLTARDLVVGLRAEMAAAGSKVRDLELQVHMLTVERDDLSLQNERLQHRLNHRRPVVRIVSRLIRMVRGRIGA